MKTEVETFFATCEKREVRPNFQNSDPSNILARGVFRTVLLAVNYTLKKLHYNRRLAKVLNTFPLVVGIDLFVVLRIFVLPSSCVDALAKS